MDYQKYLDSPLWQRIRARVLKRDKWRCRSCGGRAWQVHHASYDALTMQGGADHNLYSLCGPCHEAVTFSATGQRRPFAEVRAMTVALDPVRKKGKRKGRRKGKAKRKYVPAYLRLHY